MHVYGKGSGGRVIRQPALLPANLRQGHAGAAEFGGQRQQQILRCPKLLEIFIHKRFSRSQAGAREAKRVSISSLSTGLTGCGKDTAWWEAPSLPEDSLETLYQELNSYRTSC